MATKFGLTRSSLQTLEKIVQGSLKRPWSDLISHDTILSESISGSPM